MKIPFLNRRPSFTVTDIETIDEYLQYSQSSSDQYKEHLDTELALITDSDTFFTKGYCYVCAKKSSFEVDYLYSNPEERIGSTAIPNWRERLICVTCSLNNRIRASVQFLEQQLGARSDSDIYITEQTTPLFAYFHNKYAKTSGSEYLGATIPFGESHPHTGIRNESITKLTFCDQAFDYILCFDVFEHVPEYSKAFAECLRCLKPGGVLLFTVPFIQKSQNNLLRAQIDRNGNIEHLMEPEYHGDPVNQNGCLCFNHFGWQMLDEMRDTGFKEVKAHFFWSQELAYIGGDQILFTARK